MRNPRYSDWKGVAVFIGDTQLREDVLMALIRFLLGGSALLGVLAACASPAWAQSATSAGQIVGQVLDPSGAAVADVEVTARNKDTNYTRAARSDEAGRYVLFLLPLGEYDVTA